MGLRILVIDDEESIRESLANYFQEKGHDVVTVEHPSRCDGKQKRLSHGHEECADILLIDQWMPEMTGIEYLAQRHDWGCRAKGQRKALMSANLSNEIRLQAKDLGCKIFEKPVHLGEIEDWINELA